MAKKTTLTSEEGNVIYPYSLDECIFDTDGNRLDNTIKEIKGKLTNIVKTKKVEDTIEVPVTVDADMLGGFKATEYVKKSEAINKTDVLSCLSTELENNYIKKVLVQESKNLFFPNDILVDKQLNYFNSATPNYKDNENYTIAFILLDDSKGNVTISTILTNGNKICLALMNAEKLKVDGTSAVYIGDVELNTTIQIVNGAKYLMVSYPDVQENNIMIEYGTTVSDYETYKETIYGVSVLNGLDTEKTIKNSQDIETLKNEITTTNIICYGDSLTRGAGESPYKTYCYPSVLQNLLGTNYTVYNGGVGGETVRTISSRQGSIPMIVQPTITIPNDTSKVAITITSADGGEVTPLLQGNGEAIATGVCDTINPCYIKGVKGALTLTDSVYYFNRLDSGETVIVDRPTPIITNASLTHSNDILIIWVGTNGGYDDEDDYFYKLHQMIDFSKNKERKYMVLGLTYNNVQSLDATKGFNARAKKEFGRKYIDLKSYILEYGLSDEGLTATDADTTAITQGNVPPSLLYDNTHFLHYGYDVIGNQVYLRGQELGYW